MTSFTTTEDVWTNGEQAGRIGVTLDSCPMTGASQPDCCPWTAAWSVLVALYFRDRWRMHSNCDETRQWCQHGMQHIPEKCVTYPNTVISNINQTRAAEALRNWSTQNPRFQTMNKSIPLRTYVHCCFRVCSGDLQKIGGLKI